MGTSGTTRSRERAEAQGSSWLPREPKARSGLELTKTYFQIRKVRFLGNKNDVPSSTLQRTEARGAWRGDDRSVQKRQKTHSGDHTGDSGLSPPPRDTRDGEVTSPKC